MRSRLLVTATISLLAAAIASAAMTLQTGPSSCSHIGNLVVNGSFENSAPPPGSANKLYWATGTTNTPFAVPPGWTSTGAAANYAVWGSDGGSPYRIQTSDVLADGQAGLYFGNGIGAMSNLPPTFNADGSVTFPGPPTFFAKNVPVVLSQTVPTNASPAPNYCFSFWTSGEGAQGGVADGIFGLRVTNVLPGDPLQYLTVPGGLGALGASHRYDFDLVPLNPLQPITIEFYNFGHFDLSAYGGANFTTELVLDDVMVNPLPEPASLMLVLAASGVFLRRRGARTA